MAGKPLDGVVAVALEQALAPAYCSSRLADAGARVIKVEPLEGDPSRGYDKEVYGESSYFLWTNRGKESIAIDLRRDDDRAQLKVLVARADVFIQNLAPGTATRLGFGSEALRNEFPALITCDISGYGEVGPSHTLKAHDLLVQAESGLLAVSGAPGPWGRIGVSICDITTGMNALIGIQQALLQRARTGLGSAIKVSLFDSAADLMAIPYLQARYGAGPPERAGLTHPGVAPYGAFVCADGRELVLSIQTEREWHRFCDLVLRRPELRADPRFCDNINRVSNRELLDAIVQDVLGLLTYPEAEDRLTDALAAYGAINSVHDLIQHPQLRTRNMPVNSQSIQLPATPYATPWDEAEFRPAPRVGEHTAALREEFPVSTQASRPAVVT